MSTPGWLDREWFSGEQLDAALIDIDHEALLIEQGRLGELTDEQYLRYIATQLEGETDG